MRAVPAILTTLIVSSMLAAPLHAEDPLEATRHVIEQQIDAFLKDDAEAAYSFAAPAIKAKFPDKDAFFAMVKKSYEPVYRPGNYAFGRNRALGDGAVIFHELLISGRDGKSWRAVYQMTRQADGSYKIDGVAIMPDMVNKAL
jgi:ketosteroid isomerase-like protein